MNLFLFHRVSPAGKWRQRHDGHGRKAWEGANEKRAFAKRLLPHDPAEAAGAYRTEVCGYVEKTTFYKFILLNCLLIKQCMAIYRILPSLISWLCKKVWKSLLGEINNYGHALFPWAFSHAPSNDPAEQGTATWALAKSALVALRPEQFYFSVRV